MVQKKFYLFYLTLLLAMCLLTGASAYGAPPDGSLKWSFATVEAVRSCPAIGVDGTIVNMWGQLIIMSMPSTPTAPKNGASQPEGMFLFPGHRGGWHDLC